MFSILLGSYIHRLLLKKYSADDFKNKIKPMLPAISTWGLMFIIFVMVSRNAKIIFAESSILLQAFLILILFYGLNFSVSTLMGKWLFKREESITLVYSTVLRNLSIALGVAVSTFGHKAGLILALAFVIQIQGATWYAKLADRREIFSKGIAPG